jgi:hypothetical protein
VSARLPCCRINQESVFAFGAFTQKNAGLLLAANALAKDVSLTHFPDGVVGLDIQKLANAFTNAVSGWNCIQEHPRILGLGCEPFSSPR